MVIPTILQKEFLEAGIQRLLESLPIRQIPLEKDKLSEVN